MSSRDKLLRVVHERQLVSYSNDTRWSKFVAKIVNLPLCFRVKWVFENEPMSWGWLLIPTRGYIEQGDLGPIPFREIEWLELNSIERQRRGALVADAEIDHSEAIDMALTESRLVFSKENKIYRIFGYREPARE